MFEDNPKRTFLFRCDECGTILSIELDKPEDIEKAMDGKMYLECPCEEGICEILLD